MQSISLVTLLALVGCCTSTILAEELYDDWKEDHYVVYAKNDEQPLGPAKTLEKLEKLQNLYRDRDDAGSKGRFIRVTDLIESSRVSVDKCHGQYLINLWRMVNMHRFYKVNIMPYLGLHAKQQLAVCKDLERYNSINIPKLEYASKRIKEVMDELNISFNNDNEAEQFDDWKQDHYIVYATKSDQDSIGHEKTLELLKKLQSLYRSRTDSGSLARLVRVTSLIGASQIGIEKCDKDSLAGLEDLVKLHKSFQVNLIPYLKFYQQKQLDLCSQKP